MKKIRGLTMIALLVMIAIVAMFAIGFAQECTSTVNTAVGTCPVNGNSYRSNDWFPTADGKNTISTSTAKISVQKILINNSDPSITQTVNFYEWGTTTNVSSASVRLVWQAVVIGTNSTQVPIDQTFAERFPLIFKRGLAIQKSSTLSTVSVSIQHR
jgi:hypothetical protein